MNLLLAGIEPSAPTPSSVAWDCLAAISEMEFEEHSVATLRLPAVWDDCFQPLQDALNQNWDAIVCLAGKNCDALAVERIAINESDVSIKDRCGRRPRSKVIVTDGDPGYWSGLPYRELSARLSEAKLEATSSHSAGTGLSNFIFYRMMHSLALRGRQIPAGLIHLPERRFKVEQAEQFASVLLSCLDGRLISESSLRIDLSAAATRSRLQSHVR